MHEMAERLRLLPPAGDPSSLPPLRGRDPLSNGHAVGRCCITASSFGSRDLVVPVDPPGIEIGKHRFLKSPSSHVSPPRHQEQRKKEFE